MGEERSGPPEHPAVSPVPRSSRDPFPVAAALDRGHSHETKGLSRCLIQIRTCLHNVYRGWLSCWHGAPWTPPARASRPRREEQR